MNDPSIQPLFDIIKRAQEELSCSVCSRRFDIEEIKVRGMMDGQFLVQVSCHRSHAPALILYVVSTKQRPGNAMSTDDVLDLHQTLKTFNGDFKSVFDKQDTK